MRGLLQVAITAVIALVFGLLGAMAANHLPGRPQPPTERERASFQEKVDAMLAQDVALSRDQKAKIEVIDHNYTVDFNLTLSDLHASNAELGAALTRDMSLNPGVKKAISKIQTNVGQMQTATVNYILNVRGTLTPDQRKIFDGRIISLIL